MIMLEFLKKVNIDGDIRTSLLGKVRSLMHDKNLDERIHGITL